MNLKLKSCKNLDNKALKVLAKFPHIEILDLYLNKKISQFYYLYESEQSLISSIEVSKNEYMDRMDVDGLHYSGLDIMWVSEQW